MTLGKLSIETGMTYKELRAKCIRLGINADGKLSLENQESLKKIVRDGYLILPSKMNK
jgi:hypothetical protein